MPEYFKCPRKKCIYEGPRLHTCVHHKAHVAFIEPDGTNCCQDDLGDCPKCRPATEEEFIVDSL
jgi:hypothetical protein